MIIFNKKQRKNIIITVMVFCLPTFLNSNTIHITIQPINTNNMADTVQIQPLTITDANFEEKVMQSKLPVLVDFWAPWCGPCQIITPMIEALAKEYNDKAVIGKLNVDENPKIATKYGIRSIPTLIIFKKGELINTLQGVGSKSEMATALDTCIEKN